MATQNDLYRVIDTHPLFPGRIGYFQFQGEGPSLGVFGVH
jgi:hypothetical protein